MGHGERGGMRSSSSALIVSIRFQPEICRTLKHISGAESAVRSPTIRAWNTNPASHRDEGRERSTIDENMVLPPTVTTVLYELHERGGRRS